MKLKMELLSDVIFGNGMSIPGGEDIAVQHDSYGFPYFKGGTLKGIVREEMYNLCNLMGMSEADARDKIHRILGRNGADDMGAQAVFSDFKISEKVRMDIINELDNCSENEILDLFTNLRTFTKIGADGKVADGSLRMARCVNSGVILYGTINCHKDDEAIIAETLGMVKWIGSMRNRGFGKVKITVVEEGK